MVTTDVCLYSIYYKLEMVAASHVVSTATTLDHCSNPTVDKAHASFYLAWKVQCGWHFFIWWMNKMVLGGPKAECGR